MVTDHLGGDYLRQALENDVRAGLTSSPKWLPPKWFYDAAGSELFSRITRLAEYYPTRCELEILRRRAVDVAGLSRADTLVELGSGTSEKTVLLLDALANAGTLRAYTPVDVDAVTLEAAAGRLAVRYPGLDVRPVRADFEQHLALLPRTGRRLVAFLGGTIGNLPPAAREVFLKELRATLRPGDTLLLGADLVKDPARLVRAYDDPQGVTAAFNRNVLRVLNRELDAGFEPEAFEHVALWDDDNEWIEMRLRATRPMEVPIRALGLTIPFAEGEETRTEISAKFRREGVLDELSRAGFAVCRWYTDSSGDFALTLAAAGTAVGVT
ncbi:L-histidine N(alpha)-methyltransferase [Microbispora sp. SCL1-1]|uniref:L-histidine N(alpha)-methyltransferase n=1 Tax=Microbispora TaxID=2005 RepID=UPI00115A8133|nr:MULTISPECIES: L-histidine N(alpha)-methyltransferase [unclassified Microbispora]NJP30144.1 L-histidine N(alpha)-methyltransferase [Microbispora sp. CL1-1]TQS02771.1 L-histidine N(alpha)-methyltransferase [Microbispora sp. SCL1-1]